MDAVLRAIEVEGAVDEQRRLHIDAPLPIAGPSRVRVIILVPEEAETDETEWLYAAATNPAFGFLKESLEDIYTPDDGKPFNPDRQRTRLKSRIFGPK